jgi:hypothetical protein
MTIEYRGPGFLSFVWFGSSPTPSPTLSKLSLFLGLPVCHRSILLTWEVVGVGKEPNPSTARKPALYNSYSNILWYGIWCSRCCSSETRHSLRLWWTYNYIYTLASMSLCLVPASIAVRTRHINAHSQKNGVARRPKALLTFSVWIENWSAKKTLVWSWKNNQSLRMKTKNYIIPDSVMVKAIRYY